MTTALHIREIPFVGPIGVTMTKARKTADRANTAPAAPPLRPDVDLIDNAEGNDRIREQDKASAKAYLSKLRSA